MARRRSIRPAGPARERVSLRSKRRAHERRTPGHAARFFGALLGLTRTISVDGVRYRERSKASLERALGPRGKGSKAYEVRFPTGRPMTINATETRRYADLMPVPTLISLRRAKRFVRPGARVLILGSGTGALPHLAASWTGPHGAVVALEHDHESVRFARRRYAPTSTSLERGGPEQLAGEMDGSFDTVFVDQQWIHTCEHTAHAWSEIWRTLAPDGRVVYLGRSDAPGAAPMLTDPDAVRSESVPAPHGGVPILVMARAGANHDGPEPHRSGPADR